MSPKKLAFDADARTSIKTGLSTFVRAIKYTYGPKGRNVIVERTFGSPIITRDAGAIAKEIELADEFENMGAKMLAEVAKKTSSDAGDGSATAALIAEAVYIEGSKNVAAGADAMAIVRGTKMAAAKAVEDLKSHAKPVPESEIKNVATIAAKGDEAIGGIIAEAMDKAGKDGVVTVEEGSAAKIEVEWVEGMQFDRGYVSPYFVTDPQKMKCTLDNPYIFIYEKTLNSLPPIVPILELVADSGRPLLIISETTEGEALPALVVNTLRGIIRVCAVKAPGFGDRRKEMMLDIATLTGAKAVFEDLGIDTKKMTLKDLGTAKRVVVDKDATTIMQGGGSKNAVETRVEEIKKQIEASDSDYDKEKLRERLAKLSSGVAKINVGAATETEMKELKGRVESALSATRAAMEEGILPGGGVALMRAADSLKNLKGAGDENLGIEIIRRALIAPIRQLLSNAGHDPAVILDKLSGQPYASGFDVMTGKYGDMLKAGIADPAKVARLAFTNGASVADLLITTDVLIAKIPEKKKAPAPMPEDDMY